MCINKTRIFTSQKLAFQIALEILLKAVALIVSRRKETLCTLNHDCFFCNKVTIPSGSYSSFHYDVNRRWMSGSWSKNSAR